MLILEFRWWPHSRNIAYCLWFSSVLLFPSWARVLRVNMPPSLAYAVDILKQKHLIAQNQSLAQKLRQNHLLRRGKELRYQASCKTMLPRVRMCDSSPRSKFINSWLWKHFTSCHPVPIATNSCACSVPKGRVSRADGSTTRMKKQKKKKSFGVS